MRNEWIEAREVSIMAQSNKPSRSHRRFRPNLALASAGATVLDRRRLLSGGSAAGINPGHPAVQAAHPAVRATHAGTAHLSANRVGPAQEINKLFEAFLNDFGEAEGLYVEAIVSQSSSAVPVAATVTAPYAAGSPVIQVNDAAVFGPAGQFSTPVVAAATLGNNILGQFTLTGSFDNQLIVSLAQSSSVSLPSGTTLSATVPITAQSSAASIFPNYITASTNQLAVKLVRYFDSLPIKLPRKFALPHQPRQAGALQQYVDEQVVGGAPTSLQQSLLAIPLPATPGPDLQIYNEAVGNATNAVRLRILGGVQQIFAGKLPVVPTTSTSSTSSTISGTGATGSTSSTGGTSAGTA